MQVRASNIGADVLSRHPGLLANLEEGNLEEVYEPTVATYCATAAA